MPIPDKKWIIEWFRNSKGFVGYRYVITDINDRDFDDGPWASRNKKLNVQPLEIPIKEKDNDDDDWNWLPNNNKR